jgi:hypothetical protein
MPGCIREWIPEEEMESIDIYIYSTSYFTLMDKIYNVRPKIGLDAPIILVFGHDVLEGGRR